MMDGETDNTLVDRLEMDRRVDYTYVTGDEWMHDGCVLEDR